MSMTGFMDKGCRKKLEVTIRKIRTLLYFLFCKHSSSEAVVPLELKKEAA
jgi:hypothetical protein